MGLNEIQKQHFVPEIYLKQFADEFGYFYQVNIANSIRFNKKSLRRINTGQVCYDPNFYRLSEDELKIHKEVISPNFLELYGFSYERQLNTHFNIFKSKQSHIYRRELLFFIKAYLSIKQRNKYIRDKFLGDEVLMAKIVDKAWLSTLENPFISDIVSRNIFDHQTFFNRFKSTYLNDNLRQDRTHKSMLLSTTLGLNDQYADAVNRLMCYEFTVLEANEEDFFLVTDNPGYTLKKVNSEFWPFNTDFKDFDSVIIPINSKQVFLINGHEPSYKIGIYPIRRINYRRLSRKEVMLINRRLVFVINSRIFCESEAYLKSFVNQFNFGYSR